MASIEVTINDKTKRGADSVNKNLTTVVDKANKASRSMDNLEDSLDDMGDEAQRSGNELQDLGNKANRAGKQVDGMGRAMKMAGRAFAGIGFGILAQQMLSMADSANRMRNQLKLVTDSSFELADVQNKLFAIAQSTNGGLESTTNLYARLKRSTEDLNLSQHELMTVTETIGNAIKVSGASAQAADAALMQLGQGMAAGALRGEELNSVLEQTPRLATAIADGMGVGLGELKKLGAEGEITSAKLVSAIASQQSTLRKEVSQTSTTLGQGMTNLTNSLTKVIENLDKATGLTGGMATAMTKLSKALDTVDSDTYANIIQGALTLIDPALGRFFEGRRNTQKLIDDKQAELDAPAQLEALVKSVTRSFQISATRAQGYARGVGDLDIRNPERSTDVKLTGTTQQTNLRYERELRKLEREANKENRQRIKELREEEKMYSDIVGHLERLNPKLGDFAGFLNGYREQIEALSKGAGIDATWSSMGTADKIGFGVDAFSLAMTGLNAIIGPINKEMQTFRANFQGLLNALEAGSGRAQDVIDELFRGDVTNTQQQVLGTFENAFSFLQTQSGIENNADAVRKMFEDLSRLDTKYIKDGVETARIGFGRLSLTEDYFKQLFGTDFETFRAQIDEAFGRDTSFQEIAEIMFDTSDSFDHLRDSAKALVTTTNQLSRATRVRFDAEEILLRSQLAQEMKNAGGDVFMQQEAYSRFQTGLTALNASSALAQSRGSGYSPEGSSTNSSPPPAGKIPVGGGGGGNVTVQPTIVPITDVIKIDPSSQMVIDLGRYISIDSIALQASIATAVQEALDDRQIVT